MIKKHSFDRGEVSQRQLRVQELLKSALNEILIRGESKNPILDNILVTITHVDISPDLRNAKFYVVPLETDKTDVIIKALNLSKKGDLYEAAQNLFDYLRKLDKLKMKRIVVMPIPEKGIGKTINERLIRASSDE